jgi:hypothetical protein
MRPEKDAVAQTRRLRIGIEITLPIDIVVGITSEMMTQLLLRHTPASSHKTRRSDSNILF